jgi:catechol 2,3-dioxygenase-like lactoylglutathione lyase family enzyme
VARIQHIAILARDNKALADFYVRVFGMHHVFTQPGVDGRDAYFVSDGNINLALLPCPPDREEGINHFGFQMDDVETTAQAALDAGATQPATKTPRDGRFAEVYVRDPVGTRVDMSAAGWATHTLTEAEVAERLKGTTPAPPEPARRS